MNHRKLLRSLLLAGSLTATAFAQQQQVDGLRMDVDKRQVQVGESLTLKIEFKQVGTGTSTSTGEPQISTPDNFEIRGASSFTSIQAVNQNSVVTNTTEYRLTATKAGTETLGPAIEMYLDAQGQKREVRSNQVTVTVVEKTGFSLFHKKKPANSQPQQPLNPNPPAPTPSPDELRDIKPLLPESHTMFILIFWLMLLALIVGFVWRQLRKPTKTTVVPPVGKAAQLKDAWKKLGNEDLSSKEFCLGLSNLVRECLQFRYDFPALDYTTDEILKNLKKLKISDDEFVAAEKCLKTCDRVLYADANLTGRDNLRGLCSALLPKVQKN